MGDGRSDEYVLLGFEGELFNREGEAWPEADITLVDLAMFAREGYEAQLAIAYISLINHINNLGERDQHCTAHRQYYRRGTHHHRQPATGAVSDQRLEDVAQAGDLAVAGDAESERLSG